MFSIFLFFSFFPYCFLFIFCFHLFLFPFCYIAYDYGTMPTSYDLRAPRRKYFHCWRQTLLLRGSVVLAKLSASGIHVTSFQSNMKCDVYARQHFNANVVLSSWRRIKFQEATDRMTKELTASAPSAMKIKVVAQTVRSSLSAAKRFR